MAGFPSRLRPRRLAPLAALTLALLARTAAAGADAPEQVEFFEKKIRPVLVEHCYRCHSEDEGKVKGGLRLDVRDAMRKGGDTGPAVVPGAPDESLLLKAVTYHDPDLKMPPKGKLPEAVVKDFETWIKLGAADPRTAAVPKPAAPARVIDVSAGKQFWSFQPPRRHAVPGIPNNKSQITSPIDAFILAKLQEKGLSFSPPADRRTWIRRVTFDLTGLPPTPEVVEAYVNDPAPDADAKVVERLLTSAHYGERWARVWLDVARYAEDQAHIVGNDQSLFYPNAFLYRDWVIRALNDDLPYDRFVKLQLAADLVAPDDPAQLPALGYLGLGPKYYGRGSLAVKADEWEDRVDVVARGLLGLTVACARCHDHKFDPIPTEDYYGLAGIFASTDMFNRPLADQPKPEAAPAGKKPDPKEKGKAPTSTMHVVREGTPTDLAVFVRGDVNNKGPVVPRHFPHVLCDGSPAKFAQGSGRRELADAIATPDNPLTARVIVNRVWAHLFGRGLVATPSNFGNLGERPSHPELLDDLAVRFMENGWSLKWLVKEVVLSATYRQDSRADAAKVAADPENRLLGRMNRRRLNVEGWRDALLTASGRLDQSVGGPSIDPQDPQQRRRTVYSGVSRLSLNPLLALFDYPDPNVHAERRVETTTPLQKLFVLNSPFMVEQSTALAERLLTEIPADADGADRRRIDRAYQVLYGRPASEAEVQLAQSFLKEGTDETARWRQYAHVLLAANEMLYVD
jgi:hypothetical protein